MSRTLDQDDLKRRPHVTFDQMAGEGCSVPATEHAVDMQRGRAVLAYGNVPRQRRHLNLLVDQVAPILLRLPVEIAKHRGREGADCRMPSAIPSISLIMADLWLEIVRC